MSGGSAGGAAATRVDAFGGERAAGAKAKAKSKAKSKAESSKKPKAAESEGDSALTDA